MTQLEIHKKIDEVIKGEAPSDPLVLNDLITVNADARAYFFASAPTLWLGWLRDHGFLDVVHSKPKDVSQYSYSTPELEYLDRAASDQPAMFTDIVLSVESDASSFNPEVLDRFLHIVGKLPVEQVVRLAPKIRSEGWVRIMKGFNRWGFEYEDVLKKLLAAGEIDAFVAVAESVLSVRAKDDVTASGRPWLNQNPFYFQDLSHTKVFEYLSRLEGADAEKGLALASTILKSIVLLGKETDDPNYDIEDPFPLYDVCLAREDLAEFEHRPKSAKRSYRIIVLRKTIVEERGQMCLGQDYRYFFYVTNDRTMTPEQVVHEANDRCNQENLHAQLKGGARALRAPLNTLDANWAYMVIVSIAWSLKAWFALMLPVAPRWRERHEADRARVLRMEFRSFVQRFMLIPAQIVRTGRRLIYRLLAWRPDLPIFFRLLDAL